MAGAEDLESTASISRGGPGGVAIARAALGAPFDVFCIPDRLYRFRFSFFPLMLFGTRIYPILSLSDPILFRKCPRSRHFKTPAGRTFARRSYSRGGASCWLERWDCSTSLGERAYLPLRRLCRVPVLHRDQNFTAVVTPRSATYRRGAWANLRSRVHEKSHAAPRARYSLQVALSCGGNRRFCLRLDLDKQQGGAVRVRPKAWP